MYFSVSLPIKHCWLVISHYMRKVTLLFVNHHSLLSITKLRNNPLSSDTITTPPSLLSDALLLSEHHYIATHCKKIHPAYPNSNHNNVEILATCQLALLCVHLQGSRWMVDTPGFGGKISSALLSPSVRTQWGGLSRCRRNRTFPDAAWRPCVTVGATDPMGWMLEHSVPVGLV